MHNAVLYDDSFPRETIYLHTDNASYIQGDTLWYKAFVVRASSLRPDSTLSRTLYVELLNAAGTLLQRSVLRLDSIGQAHGNFPLTPPLQNGFYEIRAYTRAMTNWIAPLHFPPLGGELEAAGYFTKVFPLFELPKKALPGDFTQLDIQRPESEQDFKLEHARNFDFGSKKDRRIEFFPEGGQLAAGTLAHIAYRITDGRGMPAEDSIAVFSVDGRMLCKSAPEYEGMGSFILQLPFTQESPEKGTYVQILGKSEKYKLPALSETAVALHAYEAENQDSGAPIVNIDLQPAVGMMSSDDGGTPQPLRTAVVVFSHEIPYKVYPLDLLEGITTLVVDREDFKVGINRLEVVDAGGYPLASRMIYVASDSEDGGAHAPIVTVRQNAESYEAFDPIAIELELKDEDGMPMPFTELSVSVRDERGDLVLDTQPSLSTQLNFCSELKGYVHQPEILLQNLKASRPLDLLMQVQGWRPETMEQLCMTTPFVVRQPMEDAPIIRGRVIKDNDRLAPLTNTSLDLKMYNSQGYVLSATTKADKEGVFAFEAHDDFIGDFTTSFLVKNPKGKDVWHRVMLDQWYGPKPKKYNAYEMVLNDPQRTIPQVLQGEKKVAIESNVDLFEWTDTIPRTVSRNLGEAVVKKKKSFVFELVGQEFDRYNYGGGEAHSIRHSDTYFNVDLELQRIRDAGIDVFTIREFLCYLIGDKDKAFNPDPMIHGTTPTDLVTHAQTIESVAEQLSGAKDERGEITPDKVDGTYDTKRLDDTEMDLSGDPWMPENLRVNGQHFYVIYNNHADIPMNQYNMQMPEQLKSVIVSYDAAWASKVWFMHNQTNMHFDGIIYVHTRPDWYNYKYVKGVTKRTLHGFTLPDEFKGPDYRHSDNEAPEDYRRTLYWNPRLTTDANGKATAIFYANARWHQRLRISVRGITANGRIIEYDR